MLRRAFRDRFNRTLKALHRVRMEFDFVGFRFCFFHTEGPVMITWSMGLGVAKIPEQDQKDFLAAIGNVISSWA
jgi:hypothetical protein